VTECSASRTTGHSRASNRNSIEYLLPHNRAAIRDDPATSAEHIQSAERRQYFNNVPHLQAYRVKQVILIEMWGNKSESFALFPNYIARFKAADRTNVPYISTLSNGTFEAPFSALAASERWEPTSRALLLLMEPIQSQDKLLPSTSIIIH
jgi:hypothetical protein